MLMNFGWFEIRWEKSSPVIISSISRNSAHPSLSLDPIPICDGTGMKTIDFQSEPPEFATNMKRASNWANS
jgi:hypothetical protein